MPSGYTYGGRHISEFSMEMTGMPDIPITAPFDNLTEDQAGRDGGWDFGVQYKPRIIPVDHYIWTRDKNQTSQIAREAGGHFNPRLGSRPLIFDDEPDKMYLARLSEQFSLEGKFQAFNEFSLEFICHDPFTYSVEEFTETVSGSGIIEQMGTHVSRPILVIEHNGGSATITNNAPDGQVQTVVFASNTPSGQYTIDMKAGTVKRGSEGGDRYIDSLTWFDLSQGENTVTHTANISSLTVKYRHTWL